MATDTTTPGAMLRALRAAIGQDELKRRILARYPGVRYMVAVEEIYREVVGQ